MKTSTWQEQMKTGLHDFKILWKSIVIASILVHVCYSLQYKIKPTLETTCIKRSPALRDHCFDAATLLNST